MHKYNKIEITNLNFGDLLFIKNFNKKGLDLDASGPVVFLEYVNNEKSSIYVYVPVTKRIKRVSITNVAPVRVV